jgi:hypothetical protein
MAMAKPPQYAVAEDASRIALAVAHGGGRRIRIEACLSGSGSCLARSPVTLVAMLFVSSHLDPFQSMHDTGPLARYSGH